MKEHSYFVYILASKRNGVLYVGVTNDIYRRMIEHRSGTVVGFTKKYGVRELVYYKEFADITEAISYEKRLKKWKRAWKIYLIEEDNPDWNDLSESFMEMPAGPIVISAGSPLPRG